VIMFTINKTSNDLSNFGETTVSNVRSVFKTDSAAFFLSIYIYYMMFYREQLFTNFFSTLPMLLEISSSSYLTILSARALLVPNVPVLAIPGDDNTREVLWLSDDVAHQLKTF